MDRYIFHARFCASLLMLFVRALKDLEELVQPLLDGFEAYTGVRFVLIGGRLPRQVNSVVV
jgi:hypothetical protein